MHLKSCESGPSAGELSVEKFALRLSLVGSGIACVLAFTFAMKTRSGAILLDGFYSLVILSMSLLTLKVATLIERGRSRRFQFGYYGFEPLINTLKGVIVLSVTLFALVTAVEAILHGGRSLEVGGALVFALLSTTGCFTMALILRRYSTRLDSPLLAVDARDWLVDACISSGITVAFGLAFLLERSPWASKLPYVDPVLVTGLAVMVIPIPVRTVLEGVNQLLAGAPDPTLENQIRTQIQTIATDYPIQALEFQMAQIGRALYVSIQVLIPPDFKVDQSVEQLDELDHVRERFTRVIQSLHSHADVDICFTCDQQWLKVNEDDETLTEPSALSNFI